MSIPDKFYVYCEREVGCECLRRVEDEELPVIVVAHSGQLQAEPIQEQLHTLLQDLRVQGVQHNTLHIIMKEKFNLIYICYFRKYESSL